MIFSENRFPVFGIIRNCHARPGAKPLEPFGKGSNALKAGTPAAGPESPTVQEGSLARPSVQRSSGSAPYTRPNYKGKPATKSVSSCLPRDPDHLDISAMAVFFPPALGA